MTNSLDPVPSPVPVSQTGKWTWKHTGGLLGITSFSVWMAIRGPFGVYTSWLVVMASMLLFTLIAGQGIKGMWRGAFIDERNRISLSRFQMLAWTIVILSGLATLIVARVGANPADAMQVKVDSNLWFLMGISATSLVGAPMIKSNKAASTLEKSQADVLLAAQGAELEKLKIQGQMVSHKSVHEASWSDLFTGEEVANFTFLDLGKIQMFFFTVLLVLAYGISFGAMLAASTSATTLPDALPSVSQGMVALLGISHGGYLINKAVPVPTAGS
ncbi:MAG: hypothetical protein K0U98_09020 [Deltaproteobacteria bacterium]|nr:hypothetical protein [Deltaproteobacteria bacterium]